MELLARLRNADPLAAEAAAEIEGLRARLAAAEKLADATRDLLAALPGDPAATTQVRDALEQFRPARDAAADWTSASKLLFLKTFTGLAPLAQGHFIEFARRFLADDALAMQLGDRVRAGELTRDELLAALAAAGDPADG